MAREPLIELFGIRSQLKDRIKTNKLKNLAKVFREIQDISDRNEGVEVAAVISLDKVTGKVIKEIYGEPGEVDRANLPIGYRRYLRPRITQISIHNHPRDTRRFSDTDLSTMNRRFNQSPFGLGLFHLGIDDEFYVVIYNRETDKFEFIRQINT